MKQGKTIFPSAWPAVVLVALCALFLTGVSKPANATGTLDQEFVLLTGTASQSLWSNYSFGETFTVGLDGTLTTFEVQLSNSAGVTSGVDWEVQSTAGGLPDGTVLASGTISGSSVPSAPTWISVDVSSAGVTVASGEVYAIVLTGQEVFPDPRIHWLAGLNADATYAGGEKVTKSNPSGSWAFSSSTPTDYLFRTYVPEPGQTSLTITALCALFAGAWVKKFASRSVQS